MSTSFYKVEYECDCGVDYGSCGVKCAVILKSHNTCDVYSFYHTDTHKYKGNESTPKTELGLPTHFGDNVLNAISEVIDKTESGGLTDDEWKAIRDINNI